MISFDSSSRESQLNASLHIISSAAAPKIFIQVGFSELVISFEDCLLTSLLLWTTSS